MRTLSRTSWQVAQWIWRKPLSRADSTSVWSGSSVIGEASARETFRSTNGTRQPATVKIISIACCRPWLEVAVNTRTPVAAAAAAAVTIECSDSRVTRRASISPDSHQRASVSTISVCGVIGNAGM